jgi:hypothetical protein
MDCSVQHCNNETSEKTDLYLVPTKFESVKTTYFLGKAPNLSYVYCDTCYEKMHRKNGISSMILFMILGPVLVGIGGSVLILMLSGYLSSDEESAWLIYGFLGLLLLIGGGTLLGGIVSIIQWIRKKGPNPMSKEEKELIAARLFEENVAHKNAAVGVLMTLEEYESKNAEAIRKKGIL